MSSSNDNLPPSIPPKKGNKPKPNPASDSTRNIRRPQSEQKSEQTVSRQEPVLPEIKSSPSPRPIPPTSPSSIPSKPEQKNPIEPPKLLPKRPYPLQFVVILLSLSVLGLVGMGAFLIVSPDGRSIRLFPEPTPNRLNLVTPSS